MLRKLQEPLEGAYGDVLQGINAAMDLIQRHTVSKKTGKPLKYDKHIYLFSDGQNEFDTAQLDDTLNMLANDQVEFTFCGFDFEDENNGQEDGDSSETDIDQSDGGDKNQNLNQYQTNLLKFVHGKNPDLGSFFTGDEALGFVDSATTKKVKPTTTYRGTLSFGNYQEHGSAALSMNVYVYPKTMELKLPSAKKLSLLTKGRPDGGTVQALSTSFLVKENYDSDDEEAEDLETRDFETVKAYRYGKHLIPFAEG